MFRRNRTGDVRSAMGMAGFSASSSDGSVRTFQLSPSSVLKIQKGDITVWSVDGSTDAIVNATSKLMLGDGGVDEAIHRAAGPELLEACRKVPKVQNFSRITVRCPTGEARITPAFRLPVSHVIHTVGPIYYSDEHPEISLTNAYRNSLTLAKENNVQYIAFPAISCGLYRYPFKEASRIAISVAKEFLDSFKEIHFVLFSDKLYGVWLNTANADTGLQLLAKKTLSLSSSFAPVSASRDRWLGASLCHVQTLTIATLPDLPYDYCALEPTISREIMKIHHQKHHQMYITNYNNALEQLDSAIAKGDVSAVVQLQSTIKFNGGGHVNHTIFWQNLKPTNEGGGEPPHSTLGWAIDTNFGSLEALIQKMNAEGAALQGSGWVWLALDKGNKKLSVETTANQSTSSSK
ncbi:uncharacterized protein LOC122038203 isoform X2 [Zingiber officinale]|uniref:uncharacterized protein LOC122038203 isoform X2 n=1 Tax=Zingiber officinale TaxID=94328 RepID=UPI001C4C2317|nr:uncharacterized protein LOC122038203 isoform X2 [Zingiber officinale]